MTNCKKCDQRTEGEINFCTNCGQYQKEDIKNYAENNAYFLNILCVLTIIGSVFTMGRGYLYEMVSMTDSESNYFRGWIYLGSALGTLIGAIMMLQKKLNGLYTYSFFQLIYIITVIVASFSYNDLFDSYGDSNSDTLLATGIAMFFLLPSILFLILYWTNIARKHLH